MLNDKGIKDHHDNGYIHLFILAACMAEIYSATAK